MKQKLVCLLLALTMAVPLAASAAAKPAETGSPAWSAPCRAFVLENGYRRSGQTWSDKAPAFALHDMDGDGVPELLARNNAPAAADQTAYVYTAAASGLQYAGDAGSYGPADRYAPGSGRPGLYCFNGRSGSYQGTYFTLENGKTIYILGEGRLVNLAAGDGHPAEIMDMSFAIQALSARYLVEHRGQLSSRLNNVPAEIDRDVAFRCLAARNVGIDTLTEEQHTYIYGD